MISDPRVLGAHAPHWRIQAVEQFPGSSGRNLGAVSERQTILVSYDYAARFGGKCENLAGIAPRLWSRSTPGTEQITNGNYSDSAISVVISIAHDERA